MTAARYAVGVHKGDASAFEVADTHFLLRAPLPRSYTNYLGRRLFLFLLAVQGLGAFALITLGVLLKKFRVAHEVVWPLMRGA